MKRDYGQLTNMRDWVSRFICSLLHGYHGHLHNKQSDLVDSELQIFIDWMYILNTSKHSPANQAYLLKFTLEQSLSVQPSKSKSTLTKIVNKLSNQILYVEYMYTSNIEQFIDEYGYYQKCSSTPCHHRSWDTLLQVAWLLN